jgi:hypothetical protein
MRGINSYDGKYMKDKFLGHVIKSDRLKLGIPQYELQNRIQILAIKKDLTLTNEEKEALINSGRSYLRLNAKLISCPIGTTLVGKIERGVARDVSSGDLALISEVLGVEPNKYLSLELNPLNLLSNTKQEKNNSPFFEKAIEFSPEYRVAGISILSFFSEIVELEFANKSVKVGIVQSGNVVTLRVETPEGEVLKEVEQVLNTYGLAVMGSVPLESISKNTQLVQELRTRLEVTNLELKLRKEALLENSKQYENRITNLESQIDGLHKMVGQSLLQNTNLIDTIKSLSASANPSDAFLKAVTTISELVHTTHTEEVEMKLNDSFSTIENESPGIISRLVSSFENVPASLAANFATPWVQAFLLTLPK